MATNEKTKCDVCGRYCKCSSTNGYHLCPKHYNQFKKYGKFLDNNPRTMYDLNEYHIMGLITYIDLYDCNINVVAQAIIDTEDIDKVKNIKWRLSASGYVYNTPKYSRPIHMTHIITGATEDQFVDHINHNTLDNRKFNLRIITKSQNQMNSNYKGVCQMKDGRYMAHIKILQKMINLGLYDIYEEALWVRWYAEYLIFGRYRYIKPEPMISYERKIELKLYVEGRIQSTMNNNPNLDIQGVMNDNKLIQIARTTDYNGVITS